jgi:hypothetical protein
MLNVPLLSINNQTFIQTYINSPKYLPVEKTYLGLICKVFWGGVKGLEMGRWRYRFKFMMNVMKLADKLFLVECRIWDFSN